MDLMDDRDLRILLQNILVPKYSAGIARFFNIGVTVRAEGEEGDEGPRVKIFQVAYDRERINRMIPPLIIGEMDRLKDYTPAEEFDSFNKKLLKEISKSISAGTVMFSCRTRCIFTHEIFDIINEEEARRLGELRSQGIPFGAMRKLSNSELINLVNKIGNHDLCRSVIDSEGDIRRKDTEISDPARNERSPVVQPEPFGGGERCHTQGGFQLDTAGKRFPDAVINMPF